MKHSLKFMLLTCMLILSSGIINAQNNEDRERILAPFPKAEEGMVRYVIFVDERANEQDYKVEIIPGKVMMVDCNIHRLMGRLDEEILQGWGYNYFRFTTNGQVTSTMMACDTPEVERFVAGQPLIVRYNSRLPIVIFAPEGYDIRYRIWEAGEMNESPVL